MRARRACFLTTLGAAFLLAAQAASVGAQGWLSQKLSEQISQAHRAEMQRQYDRALGIYGKAAGDAASVAELRELLRMRAGLYERLRLFEKAESDLTQALGAAEADPQLYAVRGYFYLRRDRYADALEDFVNGWKLQPDQALFRYATGRVHSALGQHAGAVDGYSDAIGLDPRNARYRLARAEAYVHLRLYREAKADYDRAIALGVKRAGDSFFARLGRGYVNLMLQDFAAAASDFDAALVIDPDAVNALMWRGYANEKRGSRALAIADYERAFRRWPDNGWIVASLRRLRSEEVTPDASPSVRPRAGD